MRLVTGRRTSSILCECRVEMSLKTKSGSASWTQLGQLKKGDVVRGRVKRVEEYGVFVELANSALTGLAHKSQVSDDFVKDIQSLFKIGQGMPCLSACSGSLL